MVSLGLNLPSLQFGLLKQRPALVIRVLLATCVAVPLAALLLLRTPIGQSLPPSITTAVMLMAICPSAPMIALKSRKLVENPELATRLQFWSACAAIISVPLWVGQLPVEAGETIWSVASKDVAYRFTVQLIPLLVGVSLRRWCAGGLNAGILSFRKAPIFSFGVTGPILIVALPTVTPC